jgi:hypothetical protein
MRYHSRGMALRRLFRGLRDGWRDSSPASRASMIALAMAVERAEHKPAPVDLLGWL